MCAKQTKELQRNYVCGQKNKNLCQVAFEQNKFVYVKVLLNSSKNNDRMNVSLCSIFFKCLWVKNCCRIWTGSPQPVASLPPTPVVTCHLQLIHQFVCSERPKHKSHPKCVVPITYLTASPVLFAVQQNWFPREQLFSTSQDRNGETEFQVDAPLPALAALDLHHVTCRATVVPLWWPQFVALHITQLGDYSFVQWKKVLMCNKDSSCSRWGFLFCLNSSANKSENWPHSPLIAFMLFLLSKWHITPFGTSLSLPKKLSKKVGDRTLTFHKTCF